MESRDAINISQNRKELSAIAYCVPHSNGFSWRLRMVDDEGQPVWKDLSGLREFVSGMRVEGWILKKTHAELDFSKTAAIQLWFKR